MNATENTTTTFEQYLTDNRWTDLDSEALTNARRVFDVERLADSTRPTTLPPCPAWCTDKPDHGFDSYSPEGDSVEHVRTHTASFGHADVIQYEYSLDGVLRYDTIGIWVLDRTEDQTAEQARELASDLLLAADLLDSITTP